MNQKQNLIILKGEDKTAQIKWVERKGGVYEVTFHNSPKKWSYGYNSIKWETKPKKIRIDDAKIYENTKELYNAKECYEFDSKFVIVFQNGYVQSYDKSVLRIKRSAIDSEERAGLIDYYREISEIVSLRTEDGESLLDKKYQRLQYVDPDSCLANYMNPSKVMPKQYVDSIVFPFGCNLSQKRAVQKALENKVSVIEGPPGTGKTQTILNIIANVLMQGKTVAVVSNNNSATLNVEDKLKKHELDFVAAFLGSSENKEAFINNQKLSLPQLDKESKEQMERLLDSIKVSNSTIDTMLSIQNSLASNRQYLRELKVEKEYYNSYFEETYDEKELVHVNKVLSSKKLMKLWVQLEYKNEQGQEKLSVIERILQWFRFGKGSGKIFAQPLDKIIPVLQYLFYEQAVKETEKSIDDNEQKLAKFDFEGNLDNLSSMSMNAFKGRLAIRYTGRARRTFSKDDLWKDSQGILNEYPLILSTTFSITSSLNSDVMYDYVIVDEASQVDLITGVLALSCARNIVIVGDLMQLPNVVSEKDKVRIEEISSRKGIKHHYRFEEHSLLSSIVQTIPSVEKTLLKEHYRCHPKIIQFCNKKFYNDQLVIMTEDAEEDDVLKVYKTVKGNHARGMVNQRQVDEIIAHVIPELGNDVNHEDIGVIAPYRAQGAQLSRSIADNTLEVDTVHKYQGREKDYIILSTVDNEISEFTDNPNLLNVAISRAKKKLRLVVSDNENNMKTNIGDLIRYIQHHNFEIAEGKVYSIFDLLYSEYAKEKEKYLKGSKKISNYDSENLINKLLMEIFTENEFKELSVAQHVPLNMIIRDMKLLNEDEIRFAMNMNTHLDFAVYRKIDKSLILAIEVDGYKYHKEGTKQETRDRMKDGILDKYGISYLRLNTTESNEKDRICSKLRAVIC